MTKLCGSFERTVALTREATTPRSSTHKLTKSGSVTIVKRQKIEVHHIDLETIVGGADKLKNYPYVLKIILEATVRRVANELLATMSSGGLDPTHAPSVGEVKNHPDIQRLLNWEKHVAAVSAARESSASSGVITAKDVRHTIDLAIPPSQVVMQDYAAVNAIMDIAVIREEVGRQGGDVSTIRPVIPTEILLDGGSGATKKGSVMGGGSETSSVGGGSSVGGSQTHRSTGTRSRASDRSSNYSFGGDYEDSSHMGSVNEDSGMYSSPSRRDRNVKGSTGQIEDIPRPLQDKTTLQAAMTRAQLANFEQSKEMYRLLKWASRQMENVNVTPPDCGIVHQVNLERMAQVVMNRTSVSNAGSIRTGSGEVGVGGTSDLAGVLTSRLRKSGSFGNSNNGNSKDAFLYPDILVGNASHVGLINGLGELAWSVGSLDAEMAMFGLSLPLSIRDVVGVYLHGDVDPLATSTDIVLAITKRLKIKSLNGAIVEFVGPGVSNLSVADRCTVAHMCGEYDAQIAFFPFDDIASQHLQQSRLATKKRHWVVLGNSKGDSSFSEIVGSCAGSRSSATSQMDDATDASSPWESVDIVKDLLKCLGLYRSQKDLKTETADELSHRYTRLEMVDLTEVQPTCSGPRRSLDRIAVTDMQETFLKALTDPNPQIGFGVDDERLDTVVCLPEEFRSRCMTASQVPQYLEEFQQETLEDGKKKLTLWTGKKNIERPVHLRHGSVVIAAISACTNASNPTVMLGAGLLAKAALQRGLKPLPHIRLQLAPGGGTVQSYLEDSGVLRHLEQLGFHNAGFGCAVCRSETAPLMPEVDETIAKESIVAVSILSGNRKLERRVHPSTRGAYLVSPPLVVAYALAGTVNINFATDPLGFDAETGEPVFLADLWPSREEIRAVESAVVVPSLVEDLSCRIAEGTRLWDSLQCPRFEMYPWDPESTELRPSRGAVRQLGFDGMAGRSSSEALMVNRLFRRARCLLFAGDSVTCDAISPAGMIRRQSASGLYLKSLGLQNRQYGSYGSRRANHEVMIRAAFASAIVRNRLLMQEQHHQHISSNQRQQWTGANASGYYSMPTGQSDSYGSPRGHYSGRNDATNSAANESQNIAGKTMHLPTGEVMPIHEAAARYRREDVDVIILGGRDFGMRNCREWAVKSCRELGVRAIIAQSFGEDFRKGLIAYGILPLLFTDGTSAESLGVSGFETFTLELPRRWKGSTDDEPWSVLVSSNAQEYTFAVSPAVFKPWEWHLIFNNGMVGVYINQIAPLNELQ
eukprot:Clim_evm52s144 gene=Clim_evmTU52s144